MKFKYLTLIGLLGAQPLFADTISTIKVPYRGPEKVTYLDDLEVTIPKDLKIEAVRGDASEMLNVKPFIIKYQGYDNSGRSSEKTKVVEMIVSSYSCNIAEEKPNSQNAVKLNSGRFEDKWRQKRSYYSYSNFIKETKQLSYYMGLFKEDQGKCFSANILVDNIQQDEVTNAGQSVSFLAEMLWGKFADLSSEGENN